MLAYVDTMIGFAGVMLLLSLLVTILVQGVVALLNLRGSNLLWGVSLLVERALGVDEERAKALAEQVLRHPALSPHGRLAEAIRSDELIRILKELAAPEEREKLAEGWARIYAAVPVEDVERLFPEDAKKAGEVLERIGAKARAELGDLKAWFDTVMDRASERFVARARIATMIFAAALSFGLHIDSLALFKQISTSPELRARLAQSADAALKLADTYADKDAKSGSVATGALKAAQADKPEIVLGAAIGEGLVTRGQGVRWIDTAIKDPEGRAAFQRAYEARYDAAARERARELVDMAAGLKGQLAQTEVVLVAQAPPGWWGQDNHLLGVLMTALFLSLGAPFWYNVLRQLGNLRPLLAGKVDQSESLKG